MAEAVDDSCIVIPFLPSLFHIASVELALPLFKDFTRKTLNAAFEEIQNGHSGALIADIQDNHESKIEGAKAILQCIPAHLRSSVSKAANGMHLSFLNWILEHSKILSTESVKKTIIYWRADGSINRVKTARQLLLNANINIVVKFHIACMYSFEESIETLWAEMKASDKTRCLNTADNPLTHFGVRWLLYRCRVPWIQAISAYVHSEEILTSTVPRFSSFFPLLSRKDRERFLFYLQYATADDIRSCLLTVSKEEQEQFLKLDASYFCILHLQWPLQNLYLESTKNMWDYIDEEDFRYMLNLLLAYNTRRKDFDYGELFEALWIRSPIHFRESANRCPIVSEKIANYVNEKRRKREADDVKEQIQKQTRVNSDSEELKKWIRKNGRLRSRTITS